MAILDDQYAARIVSTHLVTPTISSSLWTMARLPSVLSTHTCPNVPMSHSFSTTVCCTWWRR